MSIYNTTNGANSPIAGRDVIMGASTATPKADPGGASGVGNNKKVFIVHGHDEELRNLVEQLLYRIGLEPIVLANLPNKNRTVFEKIEENTGVAYALVLYTACDLGRAKTESKSHPRARQNVVFEHGYLIARLGRERVAAIVDEGVEIPSDVAGVVYISRTDNDWKLRVLKELQAAGLDFDITRA